MPSHIRQFLNRLHTIVIFTTLGILCCSDLGNSSPCLSSFVSFAPLLDSSKVEACMR